jgi:hypothetical protein
MYISYWSSHSINRVFLSLLPHHRNDDGNGILEDEDLNVRSNQASFLSLYSRLIGESLSLVPLLCWVVFVVSYLRHAVGFWFFSVRVHSTLTVLVESLPSTSTPHVDCTRTYVHFPLDLILNQSRFCLSSLLSYHRNDDGTGNLVDGDTNVLQNNYPSPSHIFRLIGEFLSSFFHSLLCVCRFGFGHAVFLVAPFLVCLLFVLHCFGNVFV